MSEYGDLTLDPDLDTFFVDPLAVDRDDASLFELVSDPN
jgi:hypothetical protein